MATTMATAMAGDPAAFARATAVHPQVLAAQCLDRIALEGRAGVAVAALLDTVDPSNDIGLRRHVWRLLQRQHALGVLQFFYRNTSSSMSSNSGGDGHPPEQVASSSQALIGKKRKRPTGSSTGAASDHRNGTTSAPASPTSAAPSVWSSSAPSGDSAMDATIAIAHSEQLLARPSSTHSYTATVHQQHNGSTPREPRSLAPAPVSAHNVDYVDSPDATRPLKTAKAGAAGRHGTAVATTATAAASPPADPAPHMPMATLSTLTLEDALRPRCTNSADSSTSTDSSSFSATADELMVVACRELRFRALNIAEHTILADEHFAILEAVGRARVLGTTVTDLCRVLVHDHSVKRLHNALDTLISYQLVVKRMMIVAKPAMRRLNIIHLPRFARAFTPHMFDDSAEFESDDACKKIIFAAAEAYLRTVPGHSCVLTDLGRDLQLQKRHLEILRSHVLHEAKRDEHYSLELFQAVLRPTKKTAMEPKILNCIRYKPPPAPGAGGLATAARRRGIVIELGLLQQIYSLIDESGEHGATIVEMRNEIVLPGNKLPYKLVSVLAGMYGLKAETIIQGKNKAFRLYTHTVSPALALVQRPSAPLLLTNGGAAEPASGVSGADAPRRSLKDALGGLEVDATRARRRTHILQRLVCERIISLSSLRASVFSMEKHFSELEQSSQSTAAGMVIIGGTGAGAGVGATAGCFSPQTPSAVGMVDPRSISRIAEELEREGALRLLQLPLPAKNVSTKFRALKCVVFPGLEHDERSIQRFVKHYCRDERLRRIHQNAERHGVIRMQSADSDDDDADDGDVDVDGERGGDDEEDAEDGLGVDTNGITGMNEAAASGGSAMTTPQMRGVKRKRDAASEAVAATTPGAPAPVVGDGGNPHAAASSASADTTATDRSASSTALVLVASRNNGGAAAPPLEISYRIRRFVSQAKSGMHAQQYRQLGFAYGVMYRCKIFHEFLWAHLHAQQQQQQQPLDDATLVADPDSDDPRASGVVFSREAVLHAMPVGLYIEVFSGGEILTPSELAVVEAAVAANRVFSDLPPALCAKLWSHESQRTAKVLGTLTDLGLITPHKIGMTSLLKILRAGYSDGRDGVLSRALKDNALGGLFLLQRRAQIVLDDHERESSQSPLELPPSPLDEPRRSVNDLPALRLVGTTEKHYSFGHALPLRFAFASVRDVARYWEALECLCLESMVMEVVNPKRHESMVCEVPKPVKTRARRMLRILAWISKSRKPAAGPKTTNTNTGTATAANATGGSGGGGSRVTAVTRMTPDKCAERRHGVVSKSYVPRAKRQVTKDATASPGADASSARKARRRSQRALALAQDEVDGDTNDGDGGGDGNDADAGTTNTAAASGHRRSTAMKRTRSAIVWTEANERDLLALFLDNCRSRWRIAVPQGLQRDGESIAFRNASLARSGFGLVTIARTLGKRRIDVKKRLKETLQEPAAKRALELAKRDAVQREHPSGVFDEEVRIVGSARLTALFRRAIMIVVSPPHEYHPLVAEELISYWSASEIRLVWRYLWLKNWIVRATEKERVRGYTTSQRLQDFLKLTTLAYPLALFRQAAEHESVISATLDEERAATRAFARTDAAVSASTSSSPHRRGVAPLNLHGASSSSSSGGAPEQVFEAEFPVNATPGQCALELACQVLGTCSLVVTHMSVADPDEDTGVSDPDARATILQHRKRNLRLLNYKSLKGGSGFAAHLAKHVHYQKPSLLMDSWLVETRAHAVTLDDRAQLQQLEAFSTAPPSERSANTAFLPSKRRRTAGNQLEQTIVALVRASCEAGIALPQLLTQLHQQHQQHQQYQPSASHADPNVDAPLESVTRATVDQCLNALIDAGTLLCVNAYAQQRFVTKEHGAVWLLRPFTLVPMRDAAPRRVVFAGEKDTLSFPWLKLDGSTHYKFLFALQRKLLALVLAAPGITEQSVFRKLERLLTLQDTREALSLLVDEGLVYIRGTRVRTQSLFRPSADAKSKSKKTHTRDTVVHLAGHALAVDRSKYVVHYFPHVECIQRFGSIVQDYQNEVAESHRAQ